MEETRNAPYFNGEDRISRLPDNLIHLIMSYMADTKYAVQTSVLSKRWIDVWKSLPFLEFHRSSFTEDKKHSFIMFVDNVFLFREDTDIQRFYMRWQDSAYDDSVTLHVNRWSLAAVKHNVQYMHIFINQCHDSAYEIPHRLLNCKSLKVLILYAYGNARYADVILQRSMNLPKLKFLSFAGLLISNVESSKRLFSSCPALESLLIGDCDIQTDNQRNLIVDSITAKKFQYVDYRHRDLQPQNDPMTNIIKLHAPNLEEFTFKGLFRNSYSLENYSPLSRVGLHMTLRAKKEDENAETYSKVPSMLKDVYAKRMMKFLRPVCMVKTMTLSSGFLEVLSQAPDLLVGQPPRFSNLQRLELEMWSTRGCLRSIAYLLSISPNIVKIVVGSKETNLVDIGDGWEAGLSLPGMLPRLEYVQIQEVEGCDAELKLLSFLLKNASVLEEVVLYPRATIESPDRLSKQFGDKLSALPRASSRIIIVWPATNKKPTTDAIVLEQ